jgi:uncharacterized protein with gpF-like domain
VALMGRLEVQFRARVAAELRRSMTDMANVFEHTGIVPVARGHNEALVQAFNAMAIATVAVFGARVMQQGKDAGLALETKGFAETMAVLALRYIASEAVRRRIASIAETTRDNIVSAVAKGYADGLGQAGVAGYIRALVPAFSKARAAMIARTEVHGAANYGATAAAKETGLPLRREWIAAEDGRTRASHAAADGQIVGMDEPFIVGDARLMFAGDPNGPADEVINCRCTIGFIVLD